MQATLARPARPRRGRPRRQRAAGHRRRPAVGLTSEEQAVHYVSTRGKAPELGFADVLLAGLAPDGGLYVPEAWPTSPAAAGAAGYADTAVAVMWPYVEGSIGRARLRGRSSPTPTRPSATPTSCPITRAGATASTRPSCSGARRWRSRTWRCSSSGGSSTTSSPAGPSAPPSWSPRRATRARPPSRRAAAATALDIVVLHPAGRVSEVQRRQMTTVDEPNVHNVAVDGTFDDCQDLVKAMFADEAFRDEVRLSAMNSINWARVMAQIVYYVTAQRHFGAAHRRSRCPPATSATCSPAGWPGAPAADPAARHRLQPQRHPHPLARDRASWRWPRCTPR